VVVRPNIVGGRSHDDGVELVKVVPTFVASSPVAAAIKAATAPVRLWCLVP
jgi:hypothetical protein